MNKNFRQKNGGRKMGMFDCAATDDRRKAQLIPERMRQLLPLPWGEGWGEGTGRFGRAVGGRGFAGIQTARSVWSASGLPALSIANELLPIRQPSPSAKAAASCTHSPALQDFASQVAPRQDL
jgi:hypothetical protein